MAKALPVLPGLWALRIREWESVPSLGLCQDLCLAAIFLVFLNKDRSGCRVFSSTQRIHFLSKVE